jgi:histidine ammonia-lyase
MLLVRANTMTYEAASPQLLQSLIDLLNDRITPVVQSRGSVGEADLGPLSNVAATLVGAGDCYYHGVRMPAAQALREAGLAPLQPFGADLSALISSNAFASGQTALLVHDAQQVLDWADLAVAMDLNALNSNPTRLSTPVQLNRPFPWLNWDAARVLRFLRGGYLLQPDPKRILIDPESLGAASIRNGSAWQAWATLRQDELIQINSSDHNPAVRVGVSPKDSWELDTPQFLKYYVKGGRESHGMHGFILSNANWDPYPLANDLQGFTLAMANMAVTISQRIQRFTSTLVTLIRPEDVLPPGTPTAPAGGGYDSAALFHDLQAASASIPPGGDALEQTVEDLQSETRLKVSHARQVTADTLELLATDVLNGTFWLRVRKAQNSARSFGAPVDAMASAFDAALARGGAAGRNAHGVAVEFLQAHPAAQFYGSLHALPSMPASTAAASHH